MKTRSALKEFMNAMGSLLNIAGNSSSHTSQEYGIQLYSRKDITPQQKDAITIGSDMKRIITRLDTLLSRLSTLGELSKESTTLEEITVDRQLAQQMYEHYRNVYFAN